MRFLLSEDQEALRDGIRALCAGRFPSERVRGGFDAEVWKELREAGVFSLAELGLGLPEAVVVLEELGRSLVPGPLVWGCLSDADDGVVTGSDGICDADGGVVLEHLERAQTVYAIDADGIRRHDAEAVRAVAEPVPNPLDPLTPFHRCRALPGGEPTEFDPAAWQRDGAVLTAAYLVGVAVAAADAAVGYAKERVQFDKPIGSFQAIKHLLADCLVRSELARAAVHAAAVQPSLRSAAAAKVTAGDAAVANARTSMQVHGGMGFTWELDAHLHLKRAWVLDRAFGTADQHATVLGS